MTSWHRPTKPPRHRHGHGNGRGAVGGRGGSTYVQYAYSILTYVLTIRMTVEDIHT